MNDSDLESYKRGNTWSPGVPLLAPVGGDGITSVIAQGSAVIIDESALPWNELNNALEAELAECEDEVEGIQEELDECAEVVAELEKEIEDLIAAALGTGGCSSLFFNDGIYNTFTGNICAARREDGKADIVWVGGSVSRPAPGGGASGTYGWQGQYRTADDVFIGLVGYGPTIPYEWSTASEPFETSASGAGVSSGTIPANAAFINWYVPGNPTSARTQL